MRFFHNIFHLSLSVLRKFIRRRDKFKCVFLLICSIGFCSAVYFIFIAAFANPARSSIFEPNEKLVSVIKTQVDQACIHPSLPLWTPLLMANHANRPQPFKCLAVEKNWVYTVNGTFRISPEAVSKHGSITCNYSPILRGADDDSVVNGDTVGSIKNGDQLLSDFFAVDCKSSTGSTYWNKHSAIVPNKEALERRSRISKNGGSREGKKLNSLGMNILIFGLDSVSRLAWMRSLPRSHSYFVDVLGGVVLEGYNIVGDGTTQALLPILTGKTETELPESRRGFKNATTVDNYPWIWNDLRDIGYVTQFGEDMTRFGTFNYRLMGFKNQPVDHYMRTFHLSVVNDWRYPHCLRGSNPEHLDMMNWMRDFVHMYHDIPKFSFLFDCELSHDSYRFLSLADDDLLVFLKYLNDEDHLNNALLIVMSDHGARFTDIRDTEQGRLEERNPYMGIRISQKFVDSYPDAYRNLKTNVHRLTTPFDVYATLREMINFTGTDLGDVKQRGISLFKEIPKQRTCIEAGIDLHWCACLDWRQLPSIDPYAKKAAEEIVKEMNNLTESQRHICEELSLKRIRSVVKLSLNADVLRFRGSLDRHGRVPDLSDSRQGSGDLYLVKLLTSPNDAVYETTVTYVADDGSFIVKTNLISRLNRYGNEPHCVMKTFPHLSKFCYCRLQP